MANKQSDGLRQILDEYDQACMGTPKHWERTEESELALQQAISKLEARERRGLERAKSRVLRRTEIPRGAKNPTRDFVVVLGEQIADIIQQDIEQLTHPQPSDPVEVYMKAHDWRWSQGGYWVHDSFGLLAPDQARYLYLTDLESRRDELERVGYRGHDDDRKADLDRQIAAVKGEDK